MRMRPLIGLVLLACTTVARPAASQNAGNPERKVLFLYSLLQHVRWPADAFQNPDEPLRLYLIGRDPFGGALDRYMADRTVDRRRIVVTHETNAVAAPLPHVAFLSADEEPRLPGLLAAYCRAPVLTVSDLDRFANRGGMIGLVEGGVFELIEDDHAVHFTLNRTAAYQARVQVGPELLHLTYPLFSSVSPCGTQ